MGPALLHCLILAPLLGGVHSQDTTTYADRVTQELVARARARHIEQDSSVRDYTAKIRYRVSFGFARRKWGDPLPVAVEEQDARIAWQMPNDLRVDMLGRRSASQLQGVDLQSTFSHPWFVPRMLGDSIRIFGASQTPARAAPHPLGAGAEKFYHFAAGDSVIINNAARRITIRSIKITPKLSDGAFVAGLLWVDIATGDVVRFTFRFVGSKLWVDNNESHDARDSATAVKTSNFVSQILELNADLEYSLQDNLHWMPYRQVIAGKVSVPLGIDFAVPFEAKTTFDDYVVNSGNRVVFDAAFPRDTTPRGRNGGRLAGGRGRPPGPPPVRADSNRARPDSAARRDTAAVRARFRNRTGYLPGGGKYEIHRPPADSMRNYAGWSDSLVLQENAADRHRLQQAMTDLAHITEALPGDMTGRPTAGFALEKFSDLLRYNRVEGTTVSVGVRLPVPVSFADLYGTARFGFADQRLLARVAAVRDAPGGRLIVAAMRDLVDVDPFAQGLTFGNSLRGIFTGHDDGAYMLGQGARLSFETSAGAGTEMMFSARAEDEQSVQSRARAFFPRIGGASGYFAENLPVREGFAVGGGLQFNHTGVGSRWMIGGEGLLVRSEAAARISGEFRLQQLVKGWATLRVKGGVAIGTDSVSQMGFAAGGLNTVRSFDFGVERGDVMWATQLDISKPSRKAVKIVGFIDAGQAGFRRDFSASPVLSGAGVGISVLGGLIRADLSHPITQTAGRGVRFDLVFSGAR